MNHKAVFLDRDDTLIQDPGYINHPDKVKLSAGATHALWQLKKMGYLIIVVSNQSGIARGLITEDQLDEVHRRMTDLLASEGVYLDGLYYCPYHPEGTVEPYNRDSDLRKPKPGMLLLAAKEKEIDLKQSWMMGDSYRDIAAGQAAGCHTILVDVPGKPRVKQADEPEPERKAVNLREAVNIIRMFEFHQKVQKAKSTVHEAREPKADKGVFANQIAPEPQNLMNPKKEEEKKTETVTAAAVKTVQEKTPTPKIERTVQEKIAPPAPAPAAAPVADKPRPAAVKAEPVREQLLPATEPPAKQAVKTTESAMKPQEEPAVRHAHTFKKSESALPENGDKTTSLLEEILQRLKSTDREGLYHEFSVFKLIAMMLQMLAAFCLVASVALWLSSKGGYERVYVMLGFTIAVQLMVIALMMYQDN